MIFGAQSYSNPLPGLIEQGKKAAKENAGKVPIYDPVGGGIIGWRDPSPGSFAGGGTAGGKAVDEATANAKTGAKEQAALTAPPDTYDATLREIARANTQLQMSATNGRAGSVLGIGTDNYTGAKAAALRNDRITSGGSRQTIGSDPNKRQRAPASIFNLPFAPANRTRF